MPSNSTNWDFMVDFSLSVSASVFPGPCVQMHHSFPFSAPILLFLFTQPPPSPPPPPFTKRTFKIQPSLPPFFFKTRSTKPSLHYPLSPHPPPTPLRFSYHTHTNPAFNTPHFTKFAVPLRILPHLSPYSPSRMVYMYRRTPGLS